VRIILITDRYAPEARAAAYHTRVLAEGWAGRGHQVRVVTRYPTGYMPAGAERAGVALREVRNGVAIERIRGVSGSMRVGLRLLDQVAVLLRISRRVLSGPRPDVVYVLSPPLLLALAAVLARWLHGVPFVLNLHDLYPQAAIDLGVLRNNALIWLAERLEQLVYRGAARILVAAPSSVAVLCRKKNVAVEKVELLWNFVELLDGPDDGGRAFRRKHGLTGEFVVMYAGLMGLAQDLDVVLDCARAVEGERQWRFVLVGDGPRAAEWRGRAAGLSNVVVLGSVSQEQYFDAIRACDVGLAPLAAKFCAPAIPGKIQTLMAVGRPVVASTPEGNDTGELLRQAGCGIAVPAGDSPALQEVLERLAADSVLREQMGRNGAQFAARWFSSTSAVLRTEAVMMRLAGGGESRPCTL
jgi:colanic acid biosynthesis glycosyl transferase WcaI